MQSKRKQTEAEAEALYWVSITFLYSLFPHPRISLGRISWHTVPLFFWLIILRRSPDLHAWLGVGVLHPVSLFLSSCSSTTAAQDFLLKDVDEIHQDCQGRLRPRRLPQVCISIASYGDIFSSRYSNLHPETCFQMLLVNVHSITNFIVRMCLGILLNWALNHLICTPLLYSLLDLYWGSS